MADNAIQISGKASNGLIFVVGGQNFDDFYSNLLAVYNGDEHRTNTTIEKVAALVDPNAQPASPPPTSGGAFRGRGNSNNNGGGQRQASQPPGQQPPLCEHGEARVWRTGTGRNNKTWKAWMCPRDRDEACEPQWVN